MRNYSLLILMIFIYSCSGHSPQKMQEDDMREAHSSASEHIVDTENNGQPIAFEAKCGFLDKEGILWFGTHNEGVYRYDGRAFTHFSEQEGLCNNHVSSILQDREGALWFGTTDGLCSYDGETFTHVPIPWSDTSDIWLDSVYPIVNPNEVRCMLQDKNGVFWIGTNGGGAYRYDGNSFIPFLQQRGRVQSDGLYHNVISSVIEDTAGNIWFTSMTHGGVSRYDGETFTHFTPKEGLSDDMVTSSLRDRTGALWFGSLGNRDGCLDRYDGKSFTHFNETDGLCHSNTWCMYEDKTGKLWLGSSRGNLCIYDGKTFTEFTTEKGQHLAHIIFIIEDATGNIWLGSGKGRLFRYDGSTLIDFTRKEGNIEY